MRNRPLYQVTLLVEWTYDHALTLQGVQQQVLTSQPVTQLPAELRALLRPEHQGYFE